MKSFLTICATLLIITQITYSQDAVTPLPQAHLTSQEEPSEDLLSMKTKALQKSAKQKENKSSHFEDDGTLVSILGYHDFSPNSPETEMRISVKKFRHQMQLLQELNLTVISLEQFSDWKNGKGRIPAQSVLITIDDGWKSVYQHAWPVLKEFKYPFTLFLYKNYVDAGGKSLSKTQLEEMLSSGLCSIGSHSVSHPYPSTLKKARKESLASYLKLLKTELSQSRKFLEETFSRPIQTYAYPGGYHTKEMFPLAKSAGYKYLFTVEPGKVNINAKNQTLSRYIILGTHDYIFRNAITFKGNNGKKIQISQLTVTPPPSFPVTPTPGATISERRPKISIDLTKLENIDPKKIEMAVQGFGKVPAKLEADTQLLTWTPYRPLRTPRCEVIIRYKESHPNLPIKWNFQIEREASYQLQAQNKYRPYPH